MCIIRLGEKGEPNNERGSTSFIIGFALRRPEGMGYFTKVVVP